MRSRRDVIAITVTLVTLIAGGAACGGPDSTPSGEAAAPGRQAGSESPDTGEWSGNTNGAGSPVRGDWLVLSMLSDPESMNPLTSNDASSSSVLRWIFPNLLRLDPETLEQRPLLATALPDISEDKLHYTFHLRDDATYSDGKPVTAADVVFALKAIKNREVLAPHARNYLNSVRDAVALDDTTVRIDLREPYFLNDLVLGGTSPLPRHHYDPDGLLEGITVEELDEWEGMAADKKERARAFAKQFNEDFHRNPVGPGAFELRNPDTDLVTGERIILTRRDDFWAPNDPWYGDAWVDRIVWRIINDTEATLVSFKRGDVDVIGLTPLQYKRPDTNNEKFNTRANKKIHVSPGYTYIGWNQKRPVFQDARLRRALGYFVDKDALIEKILHGLGEPVEGPIFVRRPEYNRELPVHAFDPAEGKRLLAEAGWSDSDGDGVLDKEIEGNRVPLRFEIISNSGNPIRKAVGLTVIDEMKRAGIDASFREIDWSIMLDKVKSFDYDAVILGWAMSVTPPDAYQVWHSSQAVQDGSNHVFFKNAEVDGILEQYRTEFDPERRIELYARFQEIIHEEQPYTFLWMQRAITTWDRRFEGVEWYPTGGTDMSEWWVPEPVQKYGS